MKLLVGAVLFASFAYASPNVTVQECKEHYENKDYKFVIDKCRTTSIFEIQDKVKGYYVGMSYKNIGNYEAAISYLFSSAQDSYANAQKAFYDLTNSSKLPKDLKIYKIMTMFDGDILSTIMKSDLSWLDKYRTPNNEEALKQYKQFRVKKIKLKSELAYDEIIYAYTLMEIYRGRTIRILNRDELKESLKILNRFATPEHTNALQILGQTYYEGDIVWQDYDKALSYFDKIKKNERTSIKSLYYMANIYIDKNEKIDKILDIYQDILGEYRTKKYWFSHGRKKDKTIIKIAKNVYNEVLELAEDNGKASYIAYHENEYFENNKKKALGYLEKAYKLGYKKAISTLAYEYEKILKHKNKDKICSFGNEVIKKYPNDKLEDVHYLLYKCAYVPAKKDIKKFEKAIYHLYKSGSEGRNTNHYTACQTLYGQDKYEDAFPFCKAFSLAGDKYSYAYTGIMYEYGNGVQQNYQEAIKYYTLGKDKGMPGAARRLALMYIEGKGVEKNEEKAIEFFEVSAKNKDKYSLKYLCSAYQNGDGVIPDINKATYWCKKAEKDGADIGDSMTWLKKGYLTSEQYEEQYNKQTSDTIQEERTPQEHYSQSNTTKYYWDCSVSYDSDGFWGWTYEDSVKMEVQAESRSQAEYLAISNSGTVKGFFGTKEVCSKYDTSCAERTGYKFSDAECRRQ